MRGVEEARGLTNRQAGVPAAGGRKGWGKAPSPPNNVAWSIAALPPEGSSLSTTHSHTPTAGPCMVRRREAGAAPRRGTCVALTMGEAQRLLKKIEDATASVLFLLLFLKILLVDLPNYQTVADA